MVRYTCRAQPRRPRSGDGAPGSLIHPDSIRSTALFQCSPPALSSACTSRPACRFHPVPGADLSLDHLIDLRHDWVFFVDADERVTPELAEEVRATTAQPDALNGYYVAREYWVWDRPMRSMYPDYNLRLIRRGKGRYEDRIVHEHMVIEGPAGYLKHHLVHRDDKGIERWLDRHNHYSSMEAVEVRRDSRWRQRLAILHSQDVLRVSDQPEARGAGRSAIALVGEVPGPAETMIAGTRRRSPGESCPMNAQRENSG